VAENWIRVRAYLSSAKVALRLAPLCKGGAQHAAGVLQDFWSAAKDNTRNGFIGDATDEMLEKWANWTGKRGAFAAWVREHHMEDDGRIPEWDEYMGELEHRREKARLKKAKQRAARRGNQPEMNGHVPEDKDGDVPGDGPGDKQGTSPPYGTERDGTVRDGTEEQRKRSSSAAAREFEPDDGRQILLDVLGPTQRAAMRASLKVFAEGYQLPNDAPKRIPTDAEISQACRECAASVGAGQITAKIVAGYIGRVMRGDTDRLPRPRTDDRANTFEGKLKAMAEGKS
jgi:hypothetical protein